MRTSLWECRVGLAAIDCGETGSDGEQHDAAAREQCNVEPGEGQRVAVTLIGNTLDLVDITLDHAALATIGLDGMSPGPGLPGQ